MAKISLIYNFNKELFILEYDENVQTITLMTLVWPYYPIDSYWYLQNNNHLFTDIAIPYFTFYEIGVRSYLHSSFAHHYLNIRNCTWACLIKVCYSSLVTVKVDIRLDCLQNPMLKPNCTKGRQGLYSDYSRFVF